MVLGLLIGREELTAFAPHRSQGAPLPPLGGGTKKIDRLIEGWKSTPSPSHASLQTRGGQGKSALCREKYAAREPLAQSGEKCPIALPLVRTILSVMLREDSSCCSGHFVIPTPSGCRVALALGLVALLWIGTSAARAQTTQGLSQGGQVGSATYEFSSDPDAVVLRMTEEIDALQNSASGPSVTVYASGRTVVQYPPYMRRAGTYETTLTPAEMREMVASLLARRIVEFDRDGVRKRLSAIRAVRRTARAAAPAGTATEPPLWEVFGKATTHIEVNLDRYRPARSAKDDKPAVQRNVARSISWYGLRADARHFPAVEEIQGLAEASGSLRALMERVDLTKVK